jgi:hypothetical protein
MIEIIWDYIIWPLFAIFAVMLLLAPFFGKDDDSGVG